MEFTLLSPLLIIIVFTIVQFILLAHQQLVMKQAAYAAARSALVYECPPTGLEGWWDNPLGTAGQMLFQKCTPDRTKVETAMRMALITISPSSSKLVQARSGRGDVTMIRLLGKFREDQRGAAAFLMVCGLVPLTLLVFFLVNGAKSINDSNRVQDAADAIALVHATETARALNTISMNQVTLTQTFAVAVNTSSLNNALVINGAMIVFNAAEIARYIKKCYDLAKAAAAATVIGAPVADAVGAAAAAVCTAVTLPEDFQLIDQGVRTFRIGNTYSPRDT